MHGATIKTVQQVDVKHYTCTCNAVAHSDQRNDLYCSPNIVRVIKSRRMR